MRSPIEDRFRSNDLELLAKGLYSDAQVIAGDRVWKVHRSIVCLRSGYMRDVLFGQFEEDTSIPKILPFDTTEKQADLLLEFIYSGSIETIDVLSLEDCVELSILGDDFLVDGMVTYATNSLWDKLKICLQAVPTTSPASGTHQTRYTANSKIRSKYFRMDFAMAVLEAYKQPDNACQRIVADFVWAAQSRLLGTLFLEQLNNNYPLFGSHVLTTLSKGPQSSFLQPDGKLTSPPCTNAQDQVDGSTQPLQLFCPQSP